MTDDEPATNNEEQIRPTPSFSAQLQAMLQSTASFSAGSKEAHASFPKPAALVDSSADPSAPTAAWTRSPERILRKLSPPTSYDDDEYDRDTMIWMNSRDVRKARKRETREFHKECRLVISIS
jgi:hypothetical protein